MLRIGKLTDYAMLIMGLMAHEPAAVLSATFIADELHLTPPTVSKILKMLADAKLVVSVRGAEGGYHLAKQPTMITVVDILTAMEGDLALTACCEKINRCALQAACLTRDNWQKINGKVTALLSNFTLLDLIATRN